MSLAEKRLFLLDMDGTIYLSDTLFDGTAEFLQYVRDIGGKYLFLTNNSSRGTDAYLAKLAKTQRFCSSGESADRHRGFRQASGGCARAL